MRSREVRCYMVDNMEKRVAINVEFRGRFQRFVKCFADGKITFNIPNLYFKLMPNEYGELYSIIDVNIEQGRNFIVCFELGFDTDMKCSLQNIDNVVNVSYGCGLSIVDINVIKC